MISVMDMTTGLFESDGTAPAARFESDKSAPCMEACQATPLLQAGLCEYVAEQALHAGMPVEVAALDLGDFLARMENAVI
ncbi:MAG: hypothetical protein C3F18_09495 [Nitrosomonadales bacterium]|nr:MAG: hypothetical protein C3F18_09495 [Nitrosomonadales bacterium]